MHSIRRTSCTEISLSSASPSVSTSLSSPRRWGGASPHPEIFQRALDALGVSPPEALFVGDTLASDIAGAAALGLHTCQALWFRADDDPDGPEPEFRAFTQMDVLTIARRLQG